MPEVVVVVGEEEEGRRWCPPPRLYFTARMVIMGSVILSGTVRGSGSRPKGRRGRDEPLAPTLCFIKDCLVEI